VRSTHAAEAVAELGSLGRTMRQRFTFLRLLAWVFGVQFVLYVVYFVLAATSHGATDWFQTAVWTIYGRVGGLVLLPIVPETWAGIGTLQLFGPLIGIVLYSVVLVTLIMILRRRHAA
jgi:hypothetical protein